MKIARAFVPSSTYFLIMYCAYTGIHLPQPQYSRYTVGLPQFSIKSVPLQLSWWKFQETMAVSNAIFLMPFKYDFKEM